jgi:hypothetical protein
MSGIDPGLAILGSGALGLLGGLFTNEANQDAASINAAAIGANQEKALDALTGSDAFRRITRDGGGFKVDQGPGAPSAANARTDLARGDEIFRAPGINAADRDFRFTLPTLASANQLVDRDLARQRGVFDEQAGQVRESQRRRFGGVENTGEVANTMDKLYQLNREFDWGKERLGMDLYNKSRGADLDIKNALKDSLALQAPAPGYVSGGPGAQASNVIAQTPPPARPADLGMALPFASGADAVARWLQNERYEQDRKDRNTLLNRWLDNQGPQGWWF